MVTKRAAPEYPLLGNRAFRFRNDRSGARPIRASGGGGERGQARVSALVFSAKRSRNARVFLGILSRDRNSATT